MKRHLYKVSVVLFFLILTLTGCPIPNPAPQWSTVGSAGFSDGSAYYTSLAFDASGVPYVAFEHSNLNTGTNKAMVMKYAGAGPSGWEIVGAADFSAGDVEFTSIVIDGAVPYVAFQDEANSERATVMKYSGTGATGWENVGSPGFSAGMIVNTALAVYGGVPYIAYKDGGSGNRATVMKYSGAGASGWVNVGSAGFSANSADHLSLAIDSTGIPYVAYRDSHPWDASPFKATVMKYTGTGASGWANVGSAGFSAGGAFYTNLSIYNNTPYIVYEDAENGNKATVMKYSGVGTTGWENVGSAGFSTGPVEYPSLAIRNGTPYVAFQNNDGSDNKATVMTYTGTRWVLVGTADFSPGQADYVSLAVCQGVPYVAFQDHANYFTATVMAYQ